MASGSDYHTRAMNLLQLFDSRALSIRTDDGDDKVTVFQEFGTTEARGNVTFLYAMDPDYLQGYDTNEEGILAYMNSVREEDLVYSPNKPDAKGNITVGNMEGKCIGVLMEIRDCDLQGGKYQYLRIPVKVNGDDKELVTSTVATVNALRVWTGEGDMKKDNGSPISWAEGKWDEATGKNTLDDYEFEVDFGTERPCYELANTGNLTYVKTEYENGLQVKGTHGGGTLAGNSLLILGYKAHINIGVDKKGNPDGSYIYEPAMGQTEVDYRLKNIKTEISDYTNQNNLPPTKLTVRAVLDVRNSTGGNQEQRISISSNTYRMRGYEVGPDGKLTGEEKDFDIRLDPQNPTVIGFKEANGKEHVIKIYAELDMLERKEISFIISNAPVGIALPDITFKANFADMDVLNNNDTIMAKAYISGEGDNRAYDEAKGNEDNVTVGIVKGGGTNLNKDVNVKLIELDGVITYTVKYQNSGDTPIDKVYFYDLLPNTNDIRNSNFIGKVLLRGIDIRTEGGAGASREVEDGAAGASKPLAAKAYYSTTEYTELYNTVKVFGGKMDGDKVTGMDAVKVEEMLKSGKNEAQEALFQPLGEVDNTGKFTYYGVTYTDIEELLAKITGVYVVAENLNRGQSIIMEITIETDGNEAGDVYKNIANSWIANDPSLPLTSKMVETAAISRRISGMVWYDANLNGIRDESDDAEKPIEDVKVTLFKKQTPASGGTGQNGGTKQDSGTGQAGDIYEICTTNVRGEPINEVITKADGAYSFEDLAAGDYIVAFSGNVLEQYTGVTDYQKNGTNDNNTNDGKMISELEATGIEKGKYSYFIKYSVDSENMTLHKPEDVEKLNNNYMEEIAHQDLGVIIAGPALPMTGGRGTLMYIISGIALMGGALICCTWRSKKYHS